MPDQFRPPHRVTFQGGKVVVAARQLGGATGKHGPAIAKPPALIETRLKAIEEEVDEILAMLNSRLRP